MKLAPGPWKAEIYSLAGDSQHVRRFRIDYLGSRVYVKEPTLRSG